jgi:hypothetical protein
VAFNAHTHASFSFYPPFIFSFTCSLSQNINHFYEWIPKTIEGQERLDKNDISTPQDYNLMVQIALL